MPVGRRFSRNRAHPPYVLVIALAAKERLCYFIAFRDGSDVMEMISCLTLVSILAAVSLSTPRAVAEPTLAKLRAVPFNQVRIDDSFWRRG